MNWIVKYRDVVVIAVMFALLIGMFIPFLFMGTASAQETGLQPSEIINEVEPDEATQEQIEAVESWFYSQDDIDDQLRQDVGSWLNTARQTDAGESSTSAETTEEPENVVIEVSENISVNSADFNRDEGTVTLRISASDRTEQVVLTDPNSSEDTGAGTVTEEGYTISRGDTVEVEFPLQYSAYTGSATVWVSAGVGETRYVSNEAQQLVNRLEWAMIPAAGFASALAVFTAALVHIYRKARKLNNEWTNVFRNI